MVRTKQMTPEVSHPGAKVCLLTSAHSPFDVRIFEKEATALAEAGYQVTLIAPHEGDRIVRGIRIRAVRPPANRFQRMFLTNWRIWRAAIEEKAEMYHLQDPELIPVGFLLKLRGKKVIYDAHEDVPEDILTKEYLPRIVRRPLAWLASVAEKGMSRTFDGIITATDHIAEKFPGRKYVIPLKNYPRLTDFPSGEAELSENVRLRCIYVGGLTTPRGILQTVRAMALLNPKHKIGLVLCGTFDSAAYEEAIRREPGFERTEYRGWQRYEGIPNLLRSMDVGIVCLQPIPQFVVSLPVKLFEYMGAGLAVIASDFPIWREIIEEAGCGICVDAQDPRQIASAMEYLYEHPEERKAMGQRAQRAILEKFNWEKESRKLISLYQGILA
jgi:glycosyltransferase involved in cell wall biosynthesis